MHHTNHRTFGRYLLVIAFPLLVVTLIFTAYLLKGGSILAGDENSQKEYEDFDAGNFSNPTNIDNEWMPLKPGMRLVYAGTTLTDEGDPVPHRVVINVTDLTKVIGGVRSLVSWDLDYSSGVLVEAELAFFAQDNDGNVWRLGEHPEEYENGKMVGNPTWIHGIKGSVAGISMKADPKLGTPSYSQGWAPDVEFTDRGQVHKMGVETCVPMGCYEDALVIAEGSKAEPDAQQLKYFARGVGNVRVGWMGEGEKTQEVLRLVDLMQLGADGLAKMREEALALEKHAYEVNKEVYGQTMPLEPLTGAKGKGKKGK